MTTKVALCLLGGLAALDTANQAHQKGEAVDLQVAFIPRAICEEVDNGYLQLLAYATFTTYDPVACAVKYIKYRRLAEGEGEARLLGKTSVGFGGHMDVMSDFPEGVVASDDLHVLVDGSTAAIYKLSLEQFADLIKRSAFREVQEETGLTEEYLSTLNFQPGGALREEDDYIDEVGRVHLCLNVEFNMSPDKFEETLGKIKETAKSDEVRNVDVLTISAGEMIMDFNLDEAFASVEAQLTTPDYDAESWTVLVVISSIRSIATTLKSTLTLTDLFQAIILKQQLVARAEAEQRATLAAGQSASDLAEAKEEADEDLKVSLDAEKAADPV